MKNRFIHYGIVLFVIAAISAGILGLVNSMTENVIKVNAEKTVNIARKEVLPDADTFKVEKSKKVGDLEFIPGYKNEKLVGYVTTVSQGGYGGDIIFVLGISKEGIITGMNIISNQETPGLGARISEKKWQSHWIGKNLNYKFNKTVDAFAGATISPTAVYTGIIKTLKIYEDEVKSNEK